MTVPCHSLVLLYYLSGNIQQSDIGFSVDILSSGDNPQVAIKECLKVIRCKVLHIGIRQTRERRKQKQVPHKLVGRVKHLGVHHGVYLLFRDISSVHYSLNIFSEIQFYKLSLYISYLQMFSFGLNTHEISRF